MFPVEISEKAASEIKKVMEEQSLENSALRVGLQGGGCSGFQYLLNFIKTSNIKHYNFLHTISPSPNGMINFSTLLSFLTYELNSLIVLVCLSFLLLS